MTAVVRKLRSQQRERFHIAGHGRGSKVDGVKTHIADQMSGCLLCSFVVSAKDQVRRRFLSTSLEYRNQHLTGNRTEGGYHMRSPDLSSQGFRARSGMPDEQVGVIFAHWQRARQQNLAC